MSAKGSSEKTALSSKKFWAYLLASVSWTLLLTSMRVWPPLDQWSSVVLLGMVVTKGVVEVGYIIGQAGLDALTKLFDVITPDSLFGKKDKEA